MIQNIYTFKINKCIQNSIIARMSITESTEENMKRDDAWDMYQSSYRVMLIRNQSLTLFIRRIEREALQNFKELMWLS